jgi:F-type H+-transporting ATPase subunit delta
LPQRWSVAVANQALARRYAVAVFSLAGEQDAVDSVGRDLQAIADAMYRTADALRFFLAPIIDRTAKARALAAALEGKVHDIALHTLLLLVRKRRESLLRELVVQYGELEMRARGTEALLVTTAKELGKAELQSLVERLERVFRKKFEVTEHVDPDLIGGVRVTMGDRRIDGTVAGRLEELSRELFGDRSTI